jgi:hypothetical protein
MTEVRMYGPYVHQLNKGGLREIIIGGKLRGSVAGNHMANEDAAVRAYAGTFEYQQKNKNWGDRSRTYIEFMTFTPVRAGLGAGAAEWRGVQLTEGYLPIKILRVLNGAGESVPV